MTPASEMPPPDDLPPDDLRADAAAGTGPELAAPSPAAPSPAARPPAAPGIAARLRIAVDRELQGGFLQGRQDVWITGQVLADAPIDGVALQVGRDVIARLAFAGPQAGGMGAVAHRFRFSLCRAAAEAQSPCRFVLVATAGPESATESFVVAFDRADDPSVGLTVDGPSCPPAAPDEAHAPVVVFVERATVAEDGQVSLLGWALSRAPIAAIRVCSPTAEIGGAQIGRQRDDVAQAYPRYPNAGRAGFVFTGHLGAGSRPVAHVRVVVVCADGTTQELVHAFTPPTLDSTPPTLDSTPAVAEPAPVGPQAGHPDARRDIPMFCDTVMLADDGRLLVSGWALSAVGIARVQVRLDGELVGTAELALPRLDVAEAHPDVPMARFSGFQLARRVGAGLIGPHEIVVTAINGLGDAASATRTVAVTPATTAHASTVAASGATTAFRLEVDMPDVIDGAVAHPVSGMLTIQGWALAPLPIVGVEVFLDGERQGRAHYGVARQDVADAFIGRPEALRSGFVFLCPLRGLPDGAHTVRIEATAADQRMAVHEFRITVREDASGTLYARIRRTLPPGPANLYADLLADVPCRPEFRLLLRLEETAGTDGANRATALDATLRSLEDQICTDWRLFVLDRAAATAGLLRRRLDGRFALLARRVTFLSGDDAAFPTAPTADGAPRPRWLGLMTPGDELGCDALAELALFAARHPAAEIIYADESRPSPVTGVREAFFKPDWSPDLLLATNYIGRPWFVTAAALVRTGATPRTLAEEGEYGLLLRCAEQAGQIGHLGRLLCHRGDAPLDPPAREHAALAAAIGRTQRAAEVLPGAVAGTWRVRRRAAGDALVSVIIPTCGARDHIRTCLATLRDKTKYPKYELICIDNIPPRDSATKSWLATQADTLVTIDEPFNWSRFNNLAAEQAQGEYLLFLNDDIEIVQEDWLDALMEHAQQPEVGVVGPLLLYPDGKVQHAGMFLASLGHARHAFRMLEAADPGYFGLAQTARNVIAVTGACLLVRRDAFAALGGFDEAHAVVNNDLDYCLRAHERGQRIVYTPHARLVHHELASRDRMQDTFDTERFATRWRRLFAAGDPYFSPRLSREADDYRPDDEPAEEIVVGHPTFRRDDVRRILAVKLDHIGDFLTGLPALRRLKRVFPTAELHVLASPGLRAVAVLEPVIDGFIPFQFFHTRSELGPRDLTEAEFQALEAVLAPYDFDLAVDFRMHPDTRQVMRYVPARVRAGYEHLGQFPFLDIALEWDKDSPLQRKRAHVSDRLLQLVDAVATASEPDRIGGRLGVGDPRPALERLPPKARALFRRPVAAVHPGVGNTARQWPAEHYAALCDLLIERSGLNVVLVGGPDERALARAVLAQVSHRRCVASLAGITPLADLPLLLSACALYVGNNSGPKHVAASLGVPTLGIHSGVVDAVEWGPLGERAIALQRNMLCKPCYLLKAEDCPRDLACLRQLTPAIVYQSCERLLRSTTPRRQMPAPRRSRPSAAGGDRMMPSEGPPAPPPVTT